MPWLSYIGRRYGRGRSGGPLPHEAAELALELDLPLDLPMARTTANRGFPLEFVEDNVANVVFAVSLPVDIVV